VQREAVARVSNGMSLVISHIGSRTAHAGPVMGAVLSMAIGERLVGNSAVWEIHVGGLARMIETRWGEGERDLPGLIVNFLVL
jgi:hypothetical protein